MSKLFEVIPVTSLEVACDGGKGPSGHPRVFLHIKREEGRITCPYCSRSFIFNNPGHHAA